MGKVFRDGLSYTTIVIVGEGQPIPEQTIEEFRRTAMFVHPGFLDQDPTDIESITMVVLYGDIPSSDHAAITSWVEAHRHQVRAMDSLVLLIELLRQYASIDPLKRERIKNKHEQKQRP